MNMDITEDQLAAAWDAMDWPAAEEKLAALQRRLTIAAFQKDDKKIVDLQKRIVCDRDIKCLAVRRVCASGASPGVDGVKWKTSSEKMKAALSLTSKNYHASPLRQVLIRAKNTGKERRQGIPTYYDRAMNVLYAYSLIPVSEAMAERKSFAFRPGRSAHDAHAYVMEALKGQNAPSLIVCADIKSYYANIQHSWLLKHVPMDKKVLREFLSAGIVFAGELFPADGTGISEGANISPYLGNFVLDGLQKYIYRSLHGTEQPDDYSDGNLIRYADDVLVTVRSEENAQRVIECLSSFLAERGLTLSMEKTHIARITDGFTFLSRTYIKKNGIIYACPSERAVTRFIDDLCVTIKNNRKSQRQLIELLNQKLKGWASYHRYSDAEEAFRKVDAAVQTALLDASLEKHPNLARAKVISKYWYMDADGRQYYALPDDKSVRVVKLADTLLLVHRPVRTNLNPYIEPRRDGNRTREIQNVTGNYRAIWERQNGRCYYCGRPILADQPRTTVTLDLKKPPSVRNSAYIHKICEPNEFQLLQTMEDVSLLHPYDVARILGGIAEYDPEQKQGPDAITPDWKYYRLKEYFSRCTANSVTLTFAEIEKIGNIRLPSSARKDARWWYHRSDRNMIFEAWYTEGYSLKKLDLKKQKITLHRDETGMSKLEIPDVLLEGRIPDDAVYELERHMQYVIDKYGLTK